MSVRDLCAALRTTAATSTIPVLVAGPAELRPETTAAGASAFLPTPYSHRQMLTAIGSLLTIVERGANRVPVSVKVVCGEGSETYVAFTRDIYATGLFLKGVSLSPKGTRLRLRLRIPGDTSRDDLDLPRSSGRMIVERLALGKLDVAAFGHFSAPLAIGKSPIRRIVPRHPIANGRSNRLTACAHQNHRDKNIRTELRSERLRLLIERLEEERTGVADEFATCTPGPILGLPNTPDRVISV